jgi:hypothetical protein
MPNVKGSTLSSRLLWVSLHHGEEGLERLNKSLSPAARAALTVPLNKAKWYPFELFVELIEVIDRVFGKGDMSLARQLGRFTADANLKTVYKLFYMVGTPKWIIDRAARLWDLHYDSGRLVIMRYPGNESEARIVGFSTPHRAHCQSVWGWCERSLELSGAKEVKGVEVRCRAQGDDECAYHLTWA